MFKLPNRRGVENAAFGVERVQPTRQVEDGVGTEVAIVDLSVIAYCMDGIAKHIHKGIPKQVDIGHFLGVTICLSYAVLLGIKVAVTTQYTNDENCLSS